MSEDHATLYVVHSLEIPTLTALADAGDELADIKLQCVAAALKARASGGPPTECCLCSSPFNEHTKPGLFAFVRFQEDGKARAFPD
jgi:hypothetical protein